MRIGEIESMLKKSLTVYFIAISLLTATSVLFFGMLASLLDKSILADRFYQMPPFASSQLYMQMLDQAIPGQLNENEKINPINYMLTTVFGIQLNEPYTIIKSELPAFRNLDHGLPVYSENNMKPPIDETTVSISGLSEHVPVFSNSQRLSPAVFVYHTHSRESWIYDKGSKDSDDNSAFHESHNITLVGQYFADQLEGIGIPVHYNSTDHDELLLKKDMKRAMSYVVSANTVVEAMKQYPEIDYIFDFHRDAVDRKYTTVNIDGADYAKIMFVIGKQNKHWEENLAFAEKIQKILDEKYPGLCRPITGYESGKGNNGEYNQSLSNHALTVEIGGIYNNLEESKRTVKLLADAFAEVYLDAIPVNVKEEGEVK